MLSEGFAQRVKSDDNGHIFLKVLRERIVDELGLTAAPLASQLAHDSLMNADKARYYDLESKYNL